MQKIWLTLVSVYHPQLTVIRHLLTFLRGSLYQTGNDLQEDPTTHGSEPLNRIQDH